MRELHRHIPNELLPLLGGTEISRNGAFKDRGPTVRDDRETTPSHCQRGETSRWSPFITTERGAVNESDATRFKDGVIKEAKELQRQHQGEKGGTCLLENVPMGFSDVDDEREGSWRELGNAREEEEGESWAPAAARASARRLRTFLEKEQGALNTFG